VAESSDHGRILFACEGGVFEDSASVAAKDGVSEE
jgi:hypothetical protein